MASKKLATIMSKTQSFTANGIVKTTFRGAAKTKPSKSDLFARISPLGDPNTSMVPVLDQWVQEGRNFKDFELQRIVRELRFRKRYTHALQVSGWMSSSVGRSFSSSDRAVQLDLIGKVRGVDSAENYFNNLDDVDRDDKVYGALLNCYVREGIVDKSLSVMQKMKELGFCPTNLNYNDLMCLYTNIGQLEKVPDVFSEMKENGIPPNIFSYKICINSYAARSDLDSVEKILKEMESQPHISMDWSIWSVVSSAYIKAGLKERALFYLKKCEESTNKEAVAYNHLISHYANLGNKHEVMRLWGLARTNVNKQMNKDYITILGSLVKLGEFEESEKLLVEWESSCLFYDFRVPNVILIGYSKGGLVEKAEAMLKDIEKRRGTASPNSWSIIAAGYVDKQNMKKAFECMKEALAVEAENKYWRPKTALIFSILNWVGENEDVDEVERFVKSLEIKVHRNREIYHTLMNAYIRCGKELDGLLERMKTDGIEEDEETAAILSSRLNSDEWINGDGIRGLIRGFWRQRCA